MGFLSKPKKKSSWVFIVLGIVIILVGLFIAYNPLYMTVNWVEVEGTIMGTEVSVGQEGGFYGISYRARLDVTFKYEYAGRTYTYMFPAVVSILRGTEDIAKADITKEAATYRTGSTRKLYVNPDNPSQAIRYLASTAAEYIATILGLFSLFGLGSIIYGLKR